MGKWRRYSVGPYRLGYLNGQAVATWRDAAGEHRFRLGRCATEPEARSRLHSFAHERAEVRARGGQTVGALFDAYVADRDLDGKQVQAFRENWKALKATFAALDPAHIDADLCRAYAKGRFQAGRSAGTVWTELTRLRSCLNWAQKRRVIRETPYVWVPAKPPPRDRVLSAKDVQRLLDGCVMPHVRLFAILALTTGGRSTALCELTWERVNFAAGTIDLRKPEKVNPLTKRVRKGRAIVPMNNLARAALAEAREGALSAHVIEWNGEPIKKIRKGFHEAVRRADLGEGVTPHVLRHTAASWMADAEIDPAQIARYLGHKDPDTARKIYSHPTTAPLAPASKVVDLKVKRSR